MMAAIANGGSADDIAPGVDFFSDLKKAGNFLPVDPDSGTIESGATPVVIDWDYLGAAAAANVDTWKTVVPEEAVVAGYYFQAINADAPHPAAARLWQEFLYSDEGQNLWLKGGARPVRGDAMAEAGTIDADLWGALPEVSGEPGHPDRRPDRHGRRVPRRQLVQGHQLSTAAPAQAGTGRRISVGRYLPVLPFFGFLAVFLLVPTITVIIGAFQDGETGGFTMGNIEALTSSAAIDTLRKSLLLSASTALLGGVLGAVLAYLIVSLGPRSIIRRTTLSIAGVLAQFGGVTLAFAWISLLGFSGLLTEVAEVVAGDRHLRLRLALRAQGPDRRLHLLPGAADGHRLHPGARGPPAPAQGGGGQPRRHQPAVLADGRHPAADAGLPRLGAAAVRQRVRGVRHGGGPGQPGQPDRARC